MQELVNELNNLIAQKSNKEMNIDEDDIEVFQEITNLYLENTSLNTNLGENAFKRFTRQYLKQLNLLNTKCKKTLIEEEEKELINEIVTLILKNHDLDIDEEIIGELMNW